MKQEFENEVKISLYICPVVRQTEGILTSSAIWMSVTV